ncbi:MAG: HPr kinase/phosphorylase [Geminicoccaceae bacterium]
MAAPHGTSGFRPFDPASDLPAFDARYDEVGVHASCVALGDAGVLIRGASGSGKSRLCALLLAEGGRLVADDRVILDADDRAITAAAPRALRGLLALRPDRLLHVPYRKRVRLELVVDLTATTAGTSAIRSTMLCGRPLARIRLDPAMPHASARVRQTLTELADG